MMNQRQLKAYYDKKQKLRETVLTLEGLREYQFKQNIPELDQELAAMETEIQTKSAELGTESAAILSTLEAVTDAVCRTLLTLHFHKGLSWKEVSACTGLSASAAKLRAYRAMKPVIPK